MDEIRAEYEQLNQVASRFVQQAQAIQQMTQRIKASMAQLEQGGWIGRGASAFFDEMNGELLPACQRFYNVLNDSSQATKEIVQVMRQAEEEAAAPFKRS
ncbi:MAG: WXG100 family type VII secretion target [Oscillochloridaceae bacterium umkhey_bin13]